MALPQNIRRYHVFLASPGDVEEHRKFVRSFFSDYNIQHAGAKGIEFLVIDWENYAAIGGGEPQKIITRQTLEKFRDSLVLVIGILGQRFGTKNRTHESGTEEEFEIALGYWKESGHPEIKWFFLDADRLEVPTNREERRKVLEQWDKVCDFRERLTRGGEGDPQVWWAGFQDLESFKEVFRRHLNLWLGASERPWNGSSSESAVYAPKEQYDYTDYGSSPDRWLRLESREYLGE